MGMAALALRPPDLSAARYHIDVAMELIDSNRKRRAEDAETARILYGQQGGQVR